MKKLIKNVHLAIIISVTIVAILHFLNYSLQVPVPEIVLFVSRLVFIATLVLLSFQRKSLTTWILVSMVIGAELGHDLPEIAVGMQIFSKIFLRMIKTVIAPLLFATLVVGIAGHSNLKQVGRMGWKSILYFELVSTIALFIGLAAINISKAGVGISLPAVAETGIPEVKKQTIQEIILHIFPENLAQAIYEGQVLQIVVFSIIFGIVVAMLTDKYKNPMIRFSESLAETMFKFTNLIMLFAPVAVGAAIAYTVGHMGLGILVNLFKLLITLYIALIVFIIFVLVPIALLFRIPIKRFVKSVAEPATIAFATTSSESALPRAMENMESFGVPRKIVAFVLPTGYSFNLDGTTLYLSLASIFVAQAAGIHMSFGQQLVMMLTLMLTSKGVAGVPRASLVILLGTAVSFGLPVEPIFIILGIDELMDMARTSVNVIGNCLASAVIARWEGELNTDVPIPEKLV
jgi:proton glutamate symport protein